MNRSMYQSTEPSDAAGSVHRIRGTSGVQFLPDQDAVSTAQILRMLADAWNQAKLPALVICQSPEAATAARHATGLESAPVQEFLHDLELARCVTSTFTGRKNLVIGHDHNPKGRFDQIMLASQAQVVVQEPLGLSADELATLTRCVSQVGGRTILCGAPETLRQTLGEVAPVVPDPVAERSHKRHSEADSTTPEPSDSRRWVIVASSPWEDGTHLVRSIHATMHEALDALPAAYAEELEDRKPFFLDNWPDGLELPTVAPAQWRASAPPGIDQRVRIKDQMVVAIIEPGELPPLPEALRPDTTAGDPLAKTRSFLVFHADSAEARKFPNDFTLVSRIEAETFEHAVWIARHAESFGTNHPGVTRLVERPRSLQAGDVIIDHDVPKQYDGRTWRRAMTSMEPTPPRVERPALDDRAPQPEPPRPQVPAPKHKF